MFFALLISALLLGAILSYGVHNANAQSDVEIVVVAASTGGTTDPAPGAYEYSNGTNIVLTAIPDSGYVFLYWVASGNTTPGHESPQPSYVIDPTTGEQIATIPNPNVQLQGIDSLAFSDNPTNITCGYGYTFTYTAIFALEGSQTPTTAAAIVVITDSVGGTTDPAPGTYEYATGDTISLTATADPGYEFQYWIVSGNTTPTHESPTPTTIIDPITGEVIGTIPNLPVPTGIDSLTFTQNPANITCGYGYAFQYTPVFTETSTTPSPSPSSTATPTPTEAPTATPTPAQTPSPSHEPAEAPDYTFLILAIVVVVIIIIIVVAVLAIRRR